MTSHRMAPRRTRLGLVTLAALLATVCGDAAAAVTAPASSDARPVMGAVRQPTPAPSGRIVNPHGNGSLVPIKVLATGTVKNLRPHQQLWLVVYARGANRYYPQQGPAKVSRRGTWSAPVYFGTQKQGAGDRHTLYLLVPTPAAITLMQKWLKDGAAHSDWPGLATLPNGAVLAAAVVVRNQTGLPGRP